MVEENHPDIILMDVNLNAEIDGIELARRIKKFCDAPIVFITSYADPETVARAKDVSPAGYLVKPFTAKDIYAAIEIAMVQSRSNRASESKTENAISDSLVSKFIFLKSGSTYIKVKPSDIDYIHADGVYLEVFTGAKKLLVRESFDSLLEKLPSDLFFQVHRSYCINLEKIESVEAEHIKVAGNEIPLGRSRKESLFRILGIA